MNNLRRYDEKDADWRFIFKFRLFLYNKPHVITNYIRYGEKAFQELHGSDQILVYLPVEWLKAINLVDTPGTNAIIQTHQQITEHFVPRSDLVLFVTSVDRAFSESERLFLERIRQWKKKVVVVITKSDLIDEPAELDEIKDFVKRNTTELLGIEPKMFSVSSRQVTEW